CRCHQPIAQAIDVLQGDQIASYGYLLPTLIITRKKLLACKDLRFQYCQKLISGLIAAVEKRIKNVFNVVEEGKAAAIAAATHPMFKFKWLSSLSKVAQENVMKAIQDAIVSLPDNPVNQPELQTVEMDDFFNFDDQPFNTTPSSSPASNSSATTSSSGPFGSTVQEVNFIKFTADQRTDFQLLNSYPTVRKIFLKTTILPSSAAVERLFSHATMYDLPKYNKLTDKNFE
ncbi:GSCOCG00011139001-RA-CDS, partial [Cotesia congregata]